MQRLFSVTGPILVLSTAMQPPHASPEVNRSGMLTVFESEITARPSMVLIAVEDTLTMDEQGAREIVKTAITLTKAYSKLVGQVVYTALKHPPGMSASIVECAMNTAPAAAAEIKTAIQKAPGEEIEGESEDLTEGSGKGTTVKETSGKLVSGKEASGKGITLQPEPPKENDWLDFMRFSSIYLTPNCSGLFPASLIPPVRPKPNSTPDPMPDVTPPPPVVFSCVVT